MSHDSETLAAIRSLRQAGFALQWLVPRTKRPYEPKWTDLPVASEAELRESHRPGDNLSVRLGEPSQVASGEFLYAFDVDIRIAELADEARSALRDMLPGVDIDSLPSVISGSGGESRHLYFCADRVFRKKKLARSEGKHRDSAGKWHYDWEIDLFGTGVHVAMPPSIHPDTGKPYTWERPFDLDMLDLGVGPTISSDLIAALGAVEDATFGYESREPLDFKPGQLERDLDALPVDRLDDYEDWTMLGMALHHQFGASDEGFDLWVQHSKRSVKFEGTDLRTMKRKWRGFGRGRKAVTMGTIRLWAQEARTADLINQFDDVEDEPEGGALDDGFDDIIGENQPVSGGDLDDDIEAALSGAMADAVDGPKELPWTSLLDVNEEGGFKPTLHNLRLIVENDVRTKNVMAFNEFTQEVVQRGAPGVRKTNRPKQAKPFVQLSGSSWLLRDPVNGDFWTEDKDNAIRAVIEAPKTQGGYSLKVPDRDLRAAVDIVGRKNCFHPVRDYLSELKWDGTKRAETLFIDYMGSPDDAYHRSVARLMLVAAVTRVFEPGAKFDTAVILEGVQGKRKSTFISILAKTWFTELDGDVTDTKQMVENLQGAWIAELNELGGFAKADVRHIKAFISRRSDKVRLAYAKRAQEYHRQSILIGSTNDDVYLKDSTGGRRFLPVKCHIEGEIDTDRLSREIDQIWAEAHALYRQMREVRPRGTLPLYLADAEARQIAERLQESRKVESSEDALAGRLGEWLSKPLLTGDIGDERDGTLRNEVCLLEIWCECLGRDEAQYQGMWPATLGRAMRQVEGWKETTRRPRFGKYGQQRAFERVGWVAEMVRPTRP